MIDSELGSLGKYFGYLAYEYAGPSFDVDRVHEYIEALRLAAQRLLEGIKERKNDLFERHITSSSRK